MFATYNVVCFLIAFAIPWFANNVSRKAVHAVCLTLGGLGLISTMFATNPYFLIVGMIGVGIAWASILAMPYVILAGAIKPERMGVYMGVFNLFIVIPQIVMSFLIPQIYQAFSAEIRSMLLFSAAFQCSSRFDRLFRQRHRTAKSRKRRRNCRARRNGSRRS